MKEYIERIVEILKEGGKVSIPTNYLTDSELETILKENQDLTLDENKDLILR